MVKRARSVVRAAKVEMPGFIKPPARDLEDEGPLGGLDPRNQVRRLPAQVHVDKGTTRIFTRNGHDWTKRFAAIAGAFKLKSQTIFDGEVVVVHEGRTNFSELQADLAKGRQDRMLFYAFDILFDNGEEARRSPGISERIRHSWSRGP